MKDKINIAELLKDCPKGMELDCTMYDNVTLFSVSTESDYPIKIVTKNGFSTRLTKYGQNVAIEDAKCVIFPKGKTTWEGFHRPFKDGDILYVRTSNQWICIYKEGGEKENVCRRYVAATSLIFVHDDFALCHRNNIKEIRFATEEEKEKLFQTIKDNGFRWNAETKTLENLEVKKFDINTLVPFDKVLVRDSDKDMWCASIFSHTCKDKYFCVGTWHNQCIPYEANKELLGTTNNPEEYGSR